MIAKDQNYCIQSFAWHLLPTVICKILYGKKRREIRIGFNPSIGQLEHAYDRCNEDMVLNMMRLLISLKTEISSLHYIAFTFLLEEWRSTEESVMFLKAVRASGKTGSTSQEK